MERMRRPSWMTSNVCDQPFVGSGVFNILSGNQLSECLRRWVTSPDPSTNHNIACDIHHGGTAKWFFQGSIFAEWKSKGSLLWIYGKRMLFPLLPESPLIAVCVLSRIWEEYPLVRHRSPSTRSKSLLIYSLVLRSSKTSQASAKQGRP